MLPFCALAFFFSYFPTLFSGRLSRATTTTWVVRALLQFSKISHSLSLKPVARSYRYIGWSYVLLFGHFVWRVRCCSAAADQPSTTFTTTLPRCRLRRGGRTGTGATATIVLVARGRPRDRAAARVRRVRRGAPIGGRLVMVMVMMVVLVLVMVMVVVVVLSGRLILGCAQQRWRRSASLRGGG